MDTKFTPGPWKATKEIEYDSNHTPMVRIENDLGLRFVKVYGITTVEAADNGRLIAAAPDLLKALEGMLEWARRVKGPNPGIEVANAYTAIKKATGE